MDIGPSELLIILLIVVLLFGVGRVGKIGGELGSAVANFRKGLREGEKVDWDAEMKRQNEAKAETNAEVKS